MRLWMYGRDGMAGSLSCNCQRILRLAFCQTIVRFPPCLPRVISILYSCSDFHFIFAPRTERCCGMRCRSGLK